jgi:hypothetical protein
MMTTPEVDGLLPLLTEPFSSSRNGCSDIFI